MIKKVQEKTELFIEFTPEEIESFGWEENQKLTISEEDGNIILTPHVKVEIDLDEFSKQELMALMNESCDRDISMNDLIAEILVEVSERIIEENNYEK